MRKIVSGWGRVLHVKTTLVRPEFLSDIKTILKNNKQSCIPYGCGRSYGDEALNENGITILTSRLNRFISFDSDRTILICESGVTFYDIQNTFLPRGVGLITSPGTGFVTVGGAIANDVHGKNHDRVGSFGCHVLWFDLQLADGKIIRCSQNENAPFFFATIGGLGLTGIITTVCLQLQKQSRMVRVQNESISTISALISRLHQVREQSTYSVAWLDLASKKKEVRSILTIGEPDESLLVVHDKVKEKKTKLIFFLSFLLNRFSIRLFNQLYYWRKKKKKYFSQTLLQFLYPLDAIHHWNYFYGKKGFYQFQCVIPDDFATEGISEIIDVVRDSSHQCYLGVLKTLGKEGVGLLSFSQKGLTLALDFPNQKNILSLLNKLESITLKYGGRIYCAKDACMSASGFEKMYPKLSDFQSVLKIVDPQKRWQSSLSKRLLIWNDVK